MSNSLDRLLSGAIATLREDVIPYLDEPEIRAATIGVLQVLDRLALCVDWSFTPLATALAVRKHALAELPIRPPDGPIPPSLWPDSSCESVRILQQAIQTADAYVLALVRWLDQAPEIAPDRRRDIERWIAGYGKATAIADLDYMPRSQTGALTNGNG